MRLNFKGRLEKYPWWLEYKSWVFQNFVIKYRFLSDPSKFSYFFNFSDETVCFCCLRVTCFGEFFSWTFFQKNICDKYRWNQEKGKFEKIRKRKKLNFCISINSDTLRMCLLGVREKFQNYLYRLISNWTFSLDY